MTQSVTVTYDGSLAPNNTVAIRTLSHSLPHLQRALDKMVYYEVYGRIRKYTALPKDFRHLSDVYLGEIQEGSVKLPLVGEIVDGLTSRLWGLMTAPYEQAAVHVGTQQQTMLRDLANIHNRIAQGEVPELTQQDLIAQQAEREREYRDAAVLGDISYFLSPLRGAEPDARINLALENNNNTMTFEFDRHKSTAFKRLVRQRQFGPPAIYTGHLEGLVRQGGGTRFPYMGSFRSATTLQASNLLIPDERSAQAVNQHNLSPNDFSFWAVPFGVYGSFDEIRGDVVFVKFVE